MSLLNIRH